MKRSKSITAFCILFGLFTLAGFGDSIVILSGKIEVVPTWIGYFTLIFGISAGGTAAGLWHMKRWGQIALRYWFVACLMLLFASALAFDSVIPGSITLVVIVAVVLSGIFLAVDRFVSSNFEVTT
jgi:hypothetical protein